MPSIDDCKAKLATFFSNGGNYTDPEGQRLFAALQQAEMESNNKRFRPESPPPEMKIPEVVPPTPLTFHFTQSRLGEGLQPRALGASIASYISSARQMSADLNGQRERIQDNLGVLHREAAQKKDALETARSDYDQEVFKNKKREVAAARLVFERKHSQEHILPEYEIAKTNASIEETEAKRAIENEQKRLNAVHAQIAFADICSEDLRSVGKIQGNHPLSVCQMVEAKTLLNFKLRKELHGKRLESREQLEDVDFKPLYNAVDWMYGLGFRDHPEAQESGFPGRGVQKTSVTRKALVNALSNVFNLQSSSAGLKTVPEE